MNEKIKKAPKWQPTEEFFQAFEMACRGHASDTRKGSDIPYIGHLLGVASAVIEAGGSLDQAMGAFLHDTVEDTNTSVAIIRDTINSNVADIVAACTDATKDEKEKEKVRQSDLTPDEYCEIWWKRKSDYIVSLTAKTFEDPSVLVALADKTYNAENTAANLRGKIGAERDAVWSKFNAGERWQESWYRGLQVAFSSNKTYTEFSQPLHQRFVSAVEEMFSPSPPQ